MLFVDWLFYIIIFFFELFLCVGDGAWHTLAEPEACTIRGGDEDMKTQSGARPLHARFRVHKRFIYHHGSVVVCSIFIFLPSRWWGGARRESATTTPLPWVKRHTRGTGDIQSVVVFWVPSLSLDLVAWLIVHIYMRCAAVHLLQR